MRTLRFSRVLNNIFVEYKSTIVNANNLDENFRVSYPSNVNSYIENQLFYHFDRKKWTLNEMIFFANNNQLCLTIFNDNMVQIAQYGVCGGCSGGFKINNNCFTINNNFIQINQ